MAETPERKVAIGAQVIKRAPALLERDVMDELSRLPNASRLLSPSPLSAEARRRGFRPPSARRLVISFQCLCLAHGAPEAAALQRSAAPTLQSQPFPSLQYS